MVQEAVQAVQAESSFGFLTELTRPPGLRSIRLHRTSETDRTELAPVTPNLRDAFQLGS